MGEYIPQAPVNEEARKRNGNLPGMGGVFNTVNLHTYHYAGNNPVKYIDPDGRESGYVIDENAVWGAGHAGWFVETGNDSYAFFEVTGLRDGAKGKYIDSGENRDGTILSNSPVQFPSAGTAGSSGKKTSAGILRSDFESKQQMLDYLGKVGDKGGFDIIIEFNTTPEQDKIILDASISIGGKYKNYRVSGNSCGIIARDVLTTPGSGISKVTGISSLLLGPVFNDTPNGIGNLLFLRNSDIAIKYAISKKR
jgi:hypothetical protein